MPNNNLYKQLMNTRKSVAKTLPKGIPTFQNAKKIINQAPSVTMKNLERGLKNLGFAGGRRTRKQRRRRMTRRH